MSVTVTVRITVIVTVVMMPVLNFFEISVSLLNSNEWIYAFYAFYAWWFYFP